MPILVVLLLMGSCHCVDWPEPPFGIGGSGSLAVTAVLTLIPLGISGVLARWAASAVRKSPGRRGEVATIYSRGRRRVGWLNLLCFVASVGLGWGWTVWHKFTGPGPDGDTLLPFAELLVPAPYLFALFAGWLLHYDAERELHVTGPDGGREFWGRLAHFGTQARPYALMVLFPVVLFTAEQSFARFAPETATDPRTQILAMCCVPLLFILMPLAVKPALGLETLPPGPTRDRLEALAKKLDFRCRDLLLWPTRGGMANAMVVGVVSPARYVIFTDKLLDGLDADELDAVFGHEVGHAKHSHMPLYAAFLLLSAAVTAAGVAAAADAVIDAGLVSRRAWEDWVSLPPLVVMAAYVFVVFGYLSRKCERQADVFGVKVAAGGAAVTVPGVNAMVRALERVAALNGMDTTAHNPRSARGWWKGVRGLLRSWQHGTIAERVRFLLLLAENPGREPGFQRRVFAVKCGLILALVAALVVFGATAGWADFPGFG